MTVYCLINCELAVDHLSGNISKTCWLTTILVLKSTARSDISCMHKGMKVLCNFNNNIPGFAYSFVCFATKYELRPFFSWGSHIILQN